MSKHSRGLPAWGNHANLVYGQPPDPDRCSWIGCHEPPVDDDLPICMDHGIQIASGMWAFLGRQPEPKPDDADEWPTDEDSKYVPADPFVYYVMLSPLTVKIGTTRDLATRMRAFRSDIQYVVAIERGGYELEHRRHRQFADERRNTRREEFHLSERLKRHIDELQPHRDELVEIATTYPLPRSAS